MKIQLVANYMFDSIYLNKDDIILAAYPKTGSTWIRFLFCNTISLNEWGGKDVDFNLLNDTMISFGDGKLNETWDHSINRIVKTHMKYNPLFRKNMVVLMLRDPRDVMISYYHFLKARNEPLYHFRDVKNRKGYQETFHNFIQHPKCGFLSFFEHYNSWKNHVDYFIKYEDFKKQPIDEFTDLLKAIGTDEIEDNIIEEAVQKSDIKNVRNFDNKEGHEDYARNFKKRTKFTRDGSIEQWKKYYDKSDIEIFKQFSEEFDFKHYY